MAWLGLGPHESYVDRQRASQFGRWQLDVRDQNARVPYARPQVMKRLEEPLLELLSLLVFNRIKMRRVLLVVVPLQHRLPIR